MLDRTQLDTLITSLETGAVALQSATDANTAAQTQAATCKAALDAATKANQDNVTALKSFVSALDADGNDPATPPTPAGGPQLPQDVPPAPEGTVSPPQPADASAGQQTPGIATPAVTA